VPPPPYYRPPPPSRGSPVLGCAFALSFLFNVLAVLVFVFGCFGLLFRSELSATPVTEVHFSGNSTSKNKVAIVQLDGVIMEGMLKHVHKEIDQAARDKSVKAVVLRINSPGGSVGASEDLHRRLTKLRDGDKEKKTDPKPLVVSMGSLAASGGYYVAMPARELFAEPTTITGSIGVYTALPNVKELGDKIGFRMNLIKQGNLKDSGSPFEEMTADQRRVWQDFVNHSYLQFVHVVEEGRKDLKGQLLKPIPIEPVVVTPPPGAINGQKDEAAGEKGSKKNSTGPYTRYLADGGIFTAEQAKKLKLIDTIGYLEEAVQAASAAAGLGEDFRSIRYEKPKSFADLFLGVRSAPRPSGALDLTRLQAGLSPRLWYLAPGYEAAGIMAVLEAEE
jgi:protease-4